MYRPNIKTARVRETARYFLLVEISERDTKHSESEYLNQFHISILSLSLSLSLSHTHTHTHTHLLSVIYFRFAKLIEQRFTLSFIAPHSFFIFSLSFWKLECLNFFNLTKTSKIPTDCFKLMNVIFTFSWLFQSELIPD